MTPVSERTSALHRIAVACCVRKMPAVVALALGRLSGILDQLEDSEEAFGLLAEVAEHVEEDCVEAPVVALEGIEQAEDAAEGTSQSEEGQ